jgi:hypothetical protein
MLFPALLLTLYTVVPAQPEPDISPILAPAIVIEEPSSRGDISPAVDLAEAVDISSVSVDPSGKSFGMALEPALVIESAQ